LLFTLGLYFQIQDKIFFFFCWPPVRSKMNGSY